MQYISAIRPQAEVYGICRIIPPEGWAPPLALDKNAFRFHTVIQAVHRLQDRLSMPAQQAFYEDLKRLMHTEGKTPKKPPSFGGREVDLFRMYRAVAKRGGYAAVTEEKRWKDIVRVLQVCVAQGFRVQGRETRTQTYMWSSMRGTAVETVTPGRVGRADHAGVCVDTWAQHVCVYRQQPMQRRAVQGSRVDRAGLLCWAVLGWVRGQTCGLSHLPCVRCLLVRLHCLCVCASAAAQQQQLQLQHAPDLPEVPAAL